jgi:hypothetical protein
VPGAAGVYGRVDNRSGHWGRGVVALEQDRDASEELGDLPALGFVGGFCQARVKRGGL